MNKIGILGGSFDPIHLGHVSMARCAFEEGGLDCVYLMPAGIQPFKVGRRMENPVHRLNMVKLVCKSQDFLRYTDIELSMAKPSYTYKTLKEVEKKLPGSEIFFIIGADSLFTIESWYKGAELLREFNFIIGHRPSEDLEDTKNKINELNKIYGDRFLLLKNPPLDISSTEIKERISIGESLNGLTTPEVEAYIQANNLYSWKPWTIEAYLKENLTEKRLAHTYRVVKLACELAEKYGIDVARTKVAALYHDMVKCKSVQELDELVKKYKLPSKYLGSPNLSHSKIAREIMERDLGISDEEVLSAVSFHTTGRPKMSNLEKIIYLADALEEGREYPEADENRKALDISLDFAMEKVLQHTVEFLREHNVDIDEDTIDALEFYRDKNMRGSMESKELGIKIARILEDKKGENLILIDISDKSSFGDVMVVATAMHKVHGQALCDHMEDSLAEEGIMPKSIEGKNSPDWILVDYGDIIVNIFTEEGRNRYNIEKLWGDCPIITLEEK